MNSNAILDIPEIRALDGPASLIRIPNQIDVPVTDRLMKIVDAPEFQRLSRISQLGLVSFVYPAANHNRFEHSLGVYRNALLFLRQFASQPKFSSAISVKQAKTLIVAALLHDIGHWPYCHPIEDIKIEGLPTHEVFASEYLNRPAIAQCLKEDWAIEPQDVIDLINKKKATRTQRLLSSILSGPIDIDKMDYLYRDSLHAGVPYGQNFDSLRLIRSLCLNESEDRLAITRKGRTAAELMVVARYVMFSEVYWHHAVRSATAMFQRGFYLWHQENSNEDGFAKQLMSMFESSEYDMIRVMQTKSDAAGKPDVKRKSDVASPQLLDRLFGTSRQLYKRAASYSCDDNETVYREIAHRPYKWLLQKSRQLSELIGEKIGREIGKDDVLIDAPPVGLEVQFNIDVFYPESNSYRKLGDVSPVVSTLAQRQFDDFVKQVRVFVAPELSKDVKSLDVDALVAQVISSD